MPDDLQRGFGLSTATYVVVASMVGAGILVSPGYMMVTLASAPVIFGMWVLGGALAMCGALCVAELAAALPQAGGEYVYVREAYGPLPAFLCGWTSLVVGFAAPLAVVSHIAALHLLTPFLGATVQTDDSLVLRLAATAIIIAMTLPNLLGQRQSGWTQNLTTLLKLALFAALVVLGFASGRGHIAHLSAGRPIEDIDSAAVAAQMFYVMFAYSGWNAATYLAGEVRDPTRTLPRALMVGCALVTVLYLAVNGVYLYAVPMADVGFDNAEALPRLAAERLFGPRVANSFSIAVGLTFLATISAFVVTGPRVYFAMARDGLFPAVAGRLSRRGGLPVIATLAQSACAIVILFATDFQELYQYASVGLALFTLLFVGAVFVLRRRRPDMPRPFRVPGYPVVPAVYLAVTLFTAIFAFKLWPRPSIYSLASILAGVPLYYAWTSLRQRR